ncbi:MAG TPA: GntR family transcriptional regulator [Caldilineaceae bacterium]|nr:GntR family transcriptional regulator [Caldilineaceae bacterium]
MLNSIKPITLRDQVFEEIQRAILEKRLKPGDHIREQELTDALQVSRTPVREALVLLERDGLVSISRNRGCFVRKFDEQDIREIFEMRTALENFAASLIIDRLQEEHFRYLEDLVVRQAESVARQEQVEVGQLDLEFHKYLVRLAGNTRLLRTWQIIAMQYTVLFSYLHEDLLRSGKQLMLDSHRALLAALRNRDLAQVSEVNRRTNAQVAAHCLECYRLQGEQNGHG